MASVPSVTFDKVDAVVMAVADRILRDLESSSVQFNVDDTLTLVKAFREFAEGMAYLTGLVPVEFVDHGRATPEVC